MRLSTSACIILFSSLLWQCVSPATELQNALHNNSKALATVDTVCLAELVKRYLSTDPCDYAEAASRITTVYNVTNSAFAECGTASRIRVGPGLHDHNGIPTVPDQAPCLMLGAIYAEVDSAWQESLLFILI